MSTLLSFDYKIHHITVSGRDVLDFFHRLSAQNFRSLQEDYTVASSFLTAQGGVLALFHAWYELGKVHLFLHPERESQVLAHIDKFHFGEDIQITSSKERTCWILSSESLSECEFLENRSFSEWPAPLFSTPWGRAIRIGTKQLETLLFFESERPKSLKSEHHTDPADFDSYLSWHLIPVDGLSINEKNIILEASLLEYIHRDKGCYPGQEVVERIFTYGNVAKKLVRLDLDKPIEKIDFPLDAFHQSNKVGYLSSMHHFYGKSFLTGYVQRALAQKGQRLDVSIDDKRYELSISSVVQDIKA